MPGRECHTADIITCTYVTATVKEGGGIERVWGV